MNIGTHGGRSCQIYIFQRLGKRNNILGNPLGRFLPLRNQQETAAIRHCQQLIAAIVVVHGKLGGVLQRYSVNGFPAVAQPILGLLSGAAAEHPKNKDHSQQNASQSFSIHHFFIVLLSKCSV